jgi:hypothetical protein
VLLLRCIGDVNSGCFQAVLAAVRAVPQIDMLDNAGLACQRGIGFKLLECRIR